MRVGPTLTVHLGLPIGWKREQMMTRVTTITDVFTIVSLGLIKDEMTSLGIVRFRVESRATTKMFPRVPSDLLMTVMTTNG